MIFGSSFKRRTDIDVLLNIMGFCTNLVDNSVKEFCGLTVEIKSDGSIRLSKIIPSCDLVFASVLYSYIFR